MKDKYRKTVWVDGKTKLDAAKLNNIEQGVENLFENALTVSEIHGRDGIRVDIINDKELLIHTAAGYYMTADEVLNAIAQAQLVDGSGNVVINLDGKADKVHTHTINDIEGLQAALEEAGITQEALEEFINSKGYATVDYVNNKVSTSIANAAPDLSGFATKTEVNSKADAASVYTKVEANQLFQPKGNYLTQHQDISGKANVGDSYTKSESNQLYQPKGDYLTQHQDISGKADATSVYTKNESDQLFQPKGNYLTQHQDISGKADVNHTHSINDLVDLPDYLTEDQATSLYQPAGNYAPTTHTHETADITGLQSYVDEKIALAQLEGKEVDLSAYITRAEANSNFQPVGNYLTQHQDISGKANVGDSYTKNESDQLYQPVGNYLTQHQDISGKADVGDSYTKNESNQLYQLKGDYVKTISVNSGTKQTIDSEGNIDLTVSSSDSRITADMIEYIESKLAYTYGYSCSISASPTSLSLPSNTTEITYTATFSVTKTNDTGSKPISLSSVSSSTSGWTKSGNTYVKTVTVDPTATSATSGSISATVTNSDGKSGNATGSSKSVSFTKPWFVFEDASGTLSDPAQVVKDLISGTRSNLKTGRNAIDVSNTSVTMTKDYLWFAIPNTRTMVDANNIAGLSALESSTAKYTPTETGLGTYSIYRWGGSLSAGEFLFNLKIN